MFRSILIPVDGSPLSLRPIQPAIDLAKMSRAGMVVLSVAEPRLYRASDYDAIQSGRDVEHMHLEAARQTVEKVRVLAEEAGVKCKSVVSMSALPCNEILSTVEKENCDLIVMATRGNMGIIDTIFSESTTQEVLQKASVPVLVFP